MKEPLMSLEEKDAEPTSHHPRKRPYHAPILVELGRVAELTAGIKGSGGDLIRKAKS